MEKLKKELQDEQKSKEILQAEASQACEEIHKLKSDFLKLQEEFKQADVVGEISPDLKEEIAELKKALELCKE